MALSWGLWCMYDGSVFFVFAWIVFSFVLRICFWHFWPSLHFWSIVQDDKKEGNRVKMCKNLIEKSLRNGLKWCFFAPFCTTAPSKSKIKTRSKHHKKALAPMLQVKRSLFYMFFSSLFGVWVFYFFAPLFSIFTWNFGAIPILSMFATWNLLGFVLEHLELNPHFLTFLAIFKLQRTQKNTKIKAKEIKNTLFLFKIPHFWHPLWLKDDDFWMLKKR